MIQLRHKLKALREARGWTIQHAAEKAKVSAVAYYYWETGQRNPSWERQQTLVEIFKLPIAELLSQDDHSA